MPVPTNTLILRKFEKQGETIRTTHITTNPPTRWKITLQVKPEIVNSRNTTPIKIYFAVLKSLLNRHKEESQEIDTIQVNFLSPPLNVTDEIMREQVKMAALYITMSQRNSRRNTALHN